MVTPWKGIKTFRRGDRIEVDVWMHVLRSSIGWGDSFRVVEAYRVNGKWFHRHEGKEKELNSDYITHWMPIPKAPI